MSVSLSGAVVHVSSRELDTCSASLPAGVWSKFDEGGAASFTFAVVIKSASSGRPAALDPKMLSRQTSVFARLLRFFFSMPPVDCDPFFGVDEMASMEAGDEPT